MCKDSTNSLSPQQLTERFDLLAAGAAEYAIVLLELDGRMICWNPGAERLFGYQSSEVIGHHFSRFFSAEDIRNGQPEHELKTARRGALAARGGKFARMEPASGATRPSHRCGTSTNRSGRSPGWCMT
jgi:PAS domain S-box-containing protein